MEVNRENIRTKTLENGRSVLIAPLVAVCSIAHMPHLLRVSALQLSSALLQHRLPLRSKSHTAKSKYRSLSASVGF